SLCCPFPMSGSVPVCLCLFPLSSSSHETVEGYRRYFNQIVGFFLVEDHVLHSTQGLLTRAFTDELWNMALSKITAVLRTHSSYCSDPDLVLELKNLIVIFADTLQGYGYPVNRLFDLLFEIRDQYNETLLKKWALVFREIFELDNYSPIPVETEEEYKSVVSRFPFHDAEIEKQDFPKKLPMSQSVPQIYVQVKEFIYASLKFSESLHRSWTEIDDMLRKSTNLLLTRTLSGCLQNLIKKPHIGLTELVQIIINTTHLEQACKYLEDFITNITNVSPETVHTTRLYGLSTFKVFLFTCVAAGSEYACCWNKGTVINFTELPVLQRSSSTCTDVVLPGSYLAFSSFCQ
uniref:Exocyst complex component 6 n=1 Tax=Hucho hucho TaxID=62062 RepID=A0A4W5KHA2_9TELE